MKRIQQLLLLAIVLVSQIASKSRHSKKGLNKNKEHKQSPVNEKRMNTYGKLTADKETMRRLLGEGLTNDYHKMLQDPKNYFISKDMTTYKGNVDVNTHVMLGSRPAQTNIGYTYGEIEPEDKMKKQREAFTTNYDEMLTNPEKKVLVLGVHPELSTVNTRYLQTDYEDPIIQPNDYTLQQMKAEEVARQTQQLAKIQRFIDIVDKELKGKMSVTDKQQQILTNLQAFMGDQPQGQQAMDQYKKVINSLVDRLKASHTDNKDKDNNTKDNKTTIKNNNNNNSKQNKEKKISPVEQAMRLLSTLESVKMDDSIKNKTPLLKDIQQQQEELEKSLDSTQAEKKVVVHKKSRKLNKKQNSK